MPSQKHNTAPADKIKRPYWGLLGRRSMLLPTWRGWLWLLILTAGLGWFVLHHLEPFLADNDPLPDGVMVVEGWVPDFGMQMVIQQVRQSPYHKIYVTGGPLDRGAPLAEFKTYAALGAASLVKMGLDPNVVEVAPAPGVRHDRTYASALALKRWLQERHVSLAQLNVITMGPHARRTRLLYTKAFGPATTVGIVAVPSQDFDPRRWWQSSAGVRTVVSEVIAYAYARVAFNPQTD